MLSLHNLTYLHPDKDLLFKNINLSISSHKKVALIGNNGAGKSTLLELIAGKLQPSEGQVKTGSKPYYVPQLFGQFNQHTIARALQVEDKLKALRDILNGYVSEANLLILNEDWTIEERCHEALAYWQLDGIDLNANLATLSGGQKTRVFLAGILIHQPVIILLDEPSNHLDSLGRDLLYELISANTGTLLVVSHDRTLLNLLDVVYELSNRGITVYGGNYNFYTEQKKIERHAFNQDLKSTEKMLRKAKEVERETAERKQKLDARGRKKQEKANLPTILMNTMRNNAEKSTSRIKDVHAEKVGAITKELNDLRDELPETDTMKVNFDHSEIHRGKVLVTAEDINYGYGPALLWQQPLTFEIRSGERIALKGLNGSGKTTLIRIILGEAEPRIGTIKRAENKPVYIDQDYSLVNNQLSVYEQAQQFNLSMLQEHEIKIRLNRFLFTKEYWEKHCSDLSGGEKMRLMLCCLTIRNKAPDMIFLDEPTNNLDNQNIDMLTAAINEYQGTLIVVSHDRMFLEQVNIKRTINLA